MLMFCPISQANELSMIIIRSNNIRDFAILDQQLENINISFILKRGNFVNMSFYLPRFKVESTIELKEIVKKVTCILLQRLLYFNSAFQFLLSSTKSFDIKLYFLDGRS